MYKVRVLIKFYSRAYGKILHPGEIADFTEEQLNNINAVNINMVEVIEKYTPFPEVDPPQDNEIDLPIIHDVDPPKTDDEPIPKVDVPQEDKTVPASTPDAEPPKTRRGRKSNK